MPRMRQRWRARGHRFASDEPGGGRWAERARTGRGGRAGASPGAAPGFQAARRPAALNGRLPPRGLVSLSYVFESGTLRRSSKPHVRVHSSVVEHSPYKRGVRRFESYCAHNFRILDLACHSESRGVGDTLPKWGKSCVASGCRERKRRAPVLRGMEALARQPRTWTATGCTTETIRTASHRSPARSPTGSTGFLATG